MDKEKLYKKAIEYWGRDAQTMMLFEEMGELQQAISKMWRAKSPVILMNRCDEALGEIADVEIMLEQMRALINLDDKIYQEKKLAKLERLKKMLDDYEISPSNSRPSGALNTD